MRRKRAAALSFFTLYTLSTHSPALPLARSNNNNARPLPGHTRRRRNWQAGSAVVRALQALPQPPQIRALSRNPFSPAAQKLKDQGIEVVKGDLTDPSSLDEALVGVASAFFVTTLPTKGQPTEDQQGKNFIAAAQRASLPFLVFSSVANATPTIGVPHFETKAVIEEALKASGLRYAVVAPVAFADNYPTEAGFALTMALGFFDAALKGKKLQLVSTDDIGYVAAEMLNNPARFAGRHVDLASDSLTMREVQQTYSRVLGRRVSKAWLPGAVVALIPHDFKQMMRWFHDVGYSADIAALKQEFPKLKSFEQWLRDQRKQ
ncbi:NmrA-like family domain-containing protein 1 [Rhodotorula toruloides]|nr:NmrA-like family domain-containing protein 1 [Rhodotorula toruloides]